MRRLGRRAARLALWTAALGLGWIAAYAVLAPPTTLLIEMERARLGAVSREWRPLEAISPHLVRSVIAAEDARFCSHWGFDVEAIRAAVAEAQGGGRRRGASTITQQTAKNAFLWPVTRTPWLDWARKGLEAGLTPLIELVWGKRRIMEVYLNVAEFGPGVFGAEAAARRWFGKGADALTLAEAARLAAILPSPRTRDPARPSDFVARRARQVAGGAETVRAERLDRCVTV